MVGTCLEETSGVYFHSILSVLRHPPFTNLNLWDRTPLRNWQRKLFKAHTHPVDEQEKVDGKWRSISSSSGFPVEVLPFLSPFISTFCSSQRACGCQWLVSQSWSLLRVGFRILSWEVRRLVRERTCPYLRVGFLKEEGGSGGPPRFTGMNLCLPISLLPGLSGAHGAAEPTLGGSVVPWSRRDRQGPAGRARGSAPQHTGTHPRLLKRPSPPRVVRDRTWPGNVGLRVANVSPGLQQSFPRPCGFLQTWLKDFHPVQACSSPCCWRIPAFPRCVSSCCRTTRVSYRCTRTPSP